MNFTKVILITLFSLSFSLYAEYSEDTVEAPHFIIISDSADIENFPLLKTEVDANIAGVIADVTVTQSYKNDGDKKIEAIYVFPASVNAAVYSMKMQIGDRTINAKIKEKQEARQIYEDAKKEGKSASLLEQLKPNIFKMNVANIMPGDLIEVELKYTELLKPVNKIYDFVFPTVVGPRYNSKAQKDGKGSDEVKTLHTKSDIPSYDFDINVSLQAGLPISNIECISHDVSIEGIAQDHAKISLNDSEKKKGNKDFIIKYKLTGDKIETGLLLSENDDEKFFLLMVQPPERPKPENIPPREYIFVVDISGSMMGEPLSISKKLMAYLLKDLSPKDKFNIILFAGGSKLFNSKSVFASKENIQKGFEFLSNEQGGGGTELLSALESINSISKEKNYSRSAVIITDGYVSVERETYDFIKDNLNEMNVFSFGIGKSVNRFLIEGMARTGLGEPSIVTNFEESEYEAKRFSKYLSQPIMTDIKVKYEGFLTYETEPKKIPDIFAERPILIYGKWDNTITGNIKLSGNTGGEELFLDIPVKKFATKIKSDALKYLWARNKLQIISDYQGISYENEYKEEITQLGLKYNLLTDFTSFVAVDSENRNLKPEEIITVEQPNPSVENTGRGFSGSSSIKARRGLGGSSSNIRYSVKSSTLMGEAPLSPYIDSDEESKSNLFELEMKKIKSYIKYTDDLKLQKGFAEIIVETGPNNQILDIRAISGTNDKYKKAALYATSKFIKEYDNPIPSNTYRFTINFDIPDKFELNHKGNKLKFEKSGNIWISKYKEGYGKQIEFLDEIKIQTKVFDQRFTLLDNVDDEIMIGIGETKEMLEDALTGMKKEGIIYIFSSPENVAAAKPDLKNYIYRHKYLILKIKITDLKIEE